MQGMYICVLAQLIKISNNSSSLKKRKKTLIANGAGSCAGVGSSNNTAFYCGTGPECNNFATRSCWNPGENKETGSCSAKDWQCKVCIKKYIYI